MLTSYDQAFKTLPKPSIENQDPLYRLFHREGTIGQKLLGQVRKDLADVSKVCEGALKQTNHLRTLMSALTKGQPLKTLFPSKLAHHALFCRHNPSALASIQSAQINVRR
jgi:hypothetical protein